MDKDQVKGAAKEVAGEIGRKTGEVIGNDKMQVKGEAKQVDGKMRWVGAMQRSKPPVTDRFSGMEARLAWRSPAWMPSARAAGGDLPNPEIRPVA